MGRHATSPETTSPADNGGSDAAAIGARIRRFRGDRDMSLSDLVLKAGVSKSHLSVIENGTGSRPGAAILHKIAVALGVTLADLLGREVKPDTPNDIPQSLVEFAKSRKLPQTDIDMLAAIVFRGEQPRTAERWEYIYNAIRMSASMDPES
ncbi:MAG: helix-turn-helix domain-containing protein [Mycobacteriales bacterium]